MDLLTVGHSSHAVDAFAALLRGAGVRQVADVRRWPRSRRHPHFDDDALAVELASHGIAYAHLVELGGHRERVAGSVNDGWDVEAFNGYADHLATEELARGVTRLTGLAGARPTAVMCAEGDWRRCHRRLLADVLVLRGAASVRHLGVDGTLEAHAITEFAVFAADAGLPRYPAQQLGLGF
ncbi:hypothetical protein DSM104299_01753 [Baekduia alba]|uniref:DUF488 domain-containing protein n=1 Tax=Baekduia alba TaxID=2997333 RepID=UPI0023407437|nr:DUF488 domain-containing protein [Baekduia alba]WCB93051.1 hypothetical protein DSM104299_01753 [Baekduia alba]